MLQLVTLEQRLYSKSEEDETGCWVWQAAKSKGYGSFWFDGQMRGAHRVSYEFMVGSIPPDLTLDHLCRNPMCINPYHLDPVPQSVNASRGLHAKGPRKSTCIRGHLYTNDNVYVRPSGQRECLTCVRLNRKSWTKRNESW